jgi:N-acetylneuraminic acid mutarotase
MPATIEPLESRVLLSPLPVVTVSAPYKGASENGPTIRAFYVTRSGDLSARLVVNLAVGGSATNAVDYGIVGSRVVLGAGLASVRIAIRPVDDARAEPRETVTLGVLAGAGYTVGTPAADWLRITDNDGADTRVNIAWTRRASSPIWRAEAQGGVVDGKLYIFGGFIGPEGPVARSDVYDPKANTWTRIADLPTRVTHAGSAVDGSKIYMAGGYVGWGDRLGEQDYGTTAVWIYDTKTNTYSAGPSLPAPRGAGAVVKIDRTLHYMGGCDLNRVDRTDHWVLNLDAPQDGWKASVPLPAPRNHFGVELVNGHVFLVGGQVGWDDATGAQDTFFVWHPLWNSWRELPKLSKAFSHHSQATLSYKGRLIVLGGVQMGGDLMRDVSAFDPKTGRWTSLTRLPESRFSGVAAVIDDVLYFTTGAATTTYRGVLS